MAIEPITVPLTEPVTHGKLTYSEIVFTRTSRTVDLCAMDLVKGDTKKGLALFASMAGVPLQVFLELSTDDYATIAQAVAPLMGKSGRKILEEAEKTETETDSGETL